MYTGCACIIQQAQGHWVTVTVTESRSRSRSLSHGHGHGRWVTVTVTVTVTESWSRSLSLGHGHSHGNGHDHDILSLRGGNLSKINVFWMMCSFLKNECVLDSKYHVEISKWIFGRVWIYLWIFTAFQKTFIHFVYILLVVCFSFLHDPWPNTTCVYNHVHVHEYMNVHTVCFNLTSLTRKHTDIFFWQRKYLTSANLSVY